MGRIIARTTNLHPTRGFTLEKSTSLNQTSNLRVFEQIRVFEILEVRVFLVLSLHNRGPTNSQSITSHDESAGKKGKNKQDKGKKNATTLHHYCHSFL